MMKLKRMACLGMAMMMSVGMLVGCASEPNQKSKEKEVEDTKKLTDEKRIEQSIESIRKEKVTVKSVTEWTPSNDAVAYSKEELNGVMSDYGVIKGNDEFNFSGTFVDYMEFNDKNNLHGGISEAKATVVKEKGSLSSWTYEASPNDPFDDDSNLIWHLFPNAVFPWDESSLEYDVGYDGDDKLEYDMKKEETENSTIYTMSFVVEKEYHDEPVHDETYSLLYEIDKKGRLIHYVWQLDKPFYWEGKDMGIPSTMKRDFIYTYES